MRYIRSAALGILLVAIMSLAHAGRSAAQAAEGILAFSPATVKNGQAFSISLAGAPPNADTKLWVDNGAGFKDFGGWIRTDGGGAIAVSRTMNCDSYLTLEPGKSLAVGDRVLTQKVYLEYAGLNKVSAIATHIKDCTKSQTTAPPSSGAPTPANVSFPGETAYSVNTSKGTSTAAYKFTPPIKNITFNQTNLSIFLGTHLRSMFWIGTRYGGGPMGRWDISDPWHPQGPEVMGMIFQGSALAFGRPQPVEHRGPFSSGAWPHPPSLGYGGGIFGELRGGEGRFIFASGEEGSGKDRPESRLITPIVTMASGQGMAFGQILDDRWQSLFEGAYAMDATEGGKFVFFGAGGRTATGAFNPLTIFDLTDLSGSVAYGSPMLNSISSQAWQDIVELQVVETPGIRNHFLIGRSRAASRTDKPRFYMGEIDADTGKIKRQNSFILDLQGTSDAQLFPGSNIKFASVSGKTYIFMAENFTRNSPQDQRWGTLKIAVYQFDPQQLALVRKGDLSFQDFPASYSASDNAWDLAKSENGSVYPLFMIAQAGKKYDPSLNYGEPQTFDTRFYEVKQMLDSNTVLSMTPAVPAVAIPGETVIRPLVPGQVVLKNLEAVNGDRGGVYNVFLKTEQGKTNLYMYRQAFLFDGRQARDPVMPYDEAASTGAETHWQGVTNNLGSSFRGQAAMRVDRVDVTSFTGAAAGPNPNPPSLPPPGTSPFPPTVPLPPAPSSTNACFNTYRNLCDPANELRKGLCSLDPAFPFCQ